MENQQQQPVMPPTNDFLSRMDVNIPNQEEPKKKLSTAAIIGIVVGAIALIGGGVFLFISLNKQEPAPVKPTISYPTGTEPDIDEEMAKRNEQREKDLLPVRNAVNIFQASQSDNQLPAPTVAAWNWLILNYISGGVVDSVDGEKYTVGGVCKFGEPCVDISNITWENNKHQIFALYNADCKGKTKDNVIVSSTRTRRVAIFAVIEGDEFICTTNGN